MGISFDFCAPGTEMFPFPGLPPLKGCVGHPHAGFPIRTSADQRVLDPSPRLFAVVLRPSSASQRQGIHRLLLCAFVACAPSLVRLLFVCVCLDLVTCFLTFVRVEMRGFEPLTSSVQGRRSPS